MRRINVLRQTQNVPTGIDDNFIQKTYSVDDEYKKVFSEEGTLFYRAVIETDPGRAGACFSRRCRSPAAAVRDFSRVAGPCTQSSTTSFSVSKVSANGCDFRSSASRRRRPRPWQQTLNEMMAEGDAWSQQQGLVLFLLIDRLVPSWQSQFFAPNFPSPIAVLRDALMAPPK